MPQHSGAWTREMLAGHACDVFEPATRNELELALIYLHGVHLESLHDKRPFLELFDRFGLPVLAPQAGPTWWTNRTCREFDPQLSAQQFVCEHVVGLAQRRWGIQPPRIGLFGTSMGGQGALRTPLFQKEGGAAVQEQGFAMPVRFRRFVLLGLWFATGGDQQAQQEEIWGDAEHRIQFPTRLSGIAVVSCEG